jgi:SAM-dependent methyltransferase
MTNYYSASLNSNRLQKCYFIASERVKQFLEAEIAFVLDRTNSNDSVLDLGCGYGRVTTRLSTTFSRQEFLELASGFNVEAEIQEVGNSLVFCKMVVK